MARPLYTAQLLQDAVGGGDSVTGEYGAGFVVVIRDVQILLLGGSTEGGQITILNSELTLMQWYVPGLAVEMRHWEGRIVLPGPTSITVTSAGDGVAAEFTISGYLLTAP